jgi:hypothetical protein
MGNCLRSSLSGVTAKCRKFWPIAACILASLALSEPALAQCLWSPRRHIAIRSTEQRLAGWIVYTIIAVPMIAMVLRDLGVGPLARWVVYAIIAVPMIAMVSQRDVGLVRWVLYAIIAVPMIDVMIDVLSRW